MSRKLRWPVFWALLAVFVISVGFLFVPGLQDLIHGPVIFVFFGLLLVLGVGLVVLAARDRTGGGLRRFFMLTGASAAGILVFVLLHNLVYGLFEYFGGPDFWGSGDEPVFFILALIVCPLGFLVGAVGSIVTGARHRFS
ncbi:MAG: hypothetical protein PVJ61_01525 [Dehalococcoidia bacterium]